MNSAIEYWVLKPKRCAESMRPNMSLDKAIEHKKEWRKQYHGSKAIDKSCRNHGSCPWCKENRTFKFRDKRPREKDEEE